MSFRLGRYVYMLINDVYFVFIMIFILFKYLLNLNEAKKRL